REGGRAVQAAACRVTEVVPAWPSGASSRGVAWPKRQLNHPGCRISLRSASALPNSILTCDHASVLQRVRSITRRTRLMRSQGCQRRGSEGELGCRSASFMSGGGHKATESLV